jgi:5-methylcytosine-specific restriction enzyme A
MEQHESASVQANSNPDATQPQIPATPPPLPLDFVSTSTQSVLSHLSSSPEAQDRLRAAFERGCLHEELVRLTHYAGPAENRNVVSIDAKGPYMKVFQDGKQLVMNTSMGVQMIINRNILLASDPVVMGVLGIHEPALSPATTSRQKTYESLQIRAVITNAGDYIMPTRAFVHDVVQKQKRIAWSTRTRNCVAAQQGWQCNVCEDLLTDCYDIDHKVPLFKGGADAFSNLQALCVPCHRNKTAAERSKGAILLP